MSKFDGTGPQGLGPKTGRGFGPCGGYMPHGGHMGPGRGRGFGRGLGRYFGWSGPQTKKEQLEVLADYEKALEEELEDVKKEKEELKKE